MTDITELALREKFEAWAEEVGALPWGILKKHRNQDGSYPGPHYTYMWKAWQAASAELVEALEKAHQRIDELENDEVRQRLANAEHQLYMAELAKNNLRASRKVQFRKRKAAEQRIAELESRTVKLPKPISVLHRREFTAAHCAIYAYPEAEVNAALDGAGIKWEAE